jgi:hypothetical protein
MIDDKTQALRVRVVLRKQPGLSARDVCARLRLDHYVATLADVERALAAYPGAFRCDQDGKWYARPPMPEPAGPEARDEVPRASYSDIGGSRTNRGELTIERINTARRTRGDPELDGAESSQILENLARRAADPNRYTRWCWLCSAVVDEATNEHCSDCNWLVCWCGACRKRDFVDRQGLVGACRREAWTLHASHELPDLDFRGRPILTATPPSLVSEQLRRLTREGSMGVLFHWSPARAVESIIELGLLARPQLRARGIGFVGHTYGDPKKASVLGAYVALSLHPKVAMMDAWSDSPVVWELDPDVLTADGALFIPANTASAQVDLADVLTRVGPVALRELVTRHGSGSQSEVLIPERVPRMAIKGIVTPDAVTERRLRSAMKERWPGGPDVEIRTADL